MAVTAVGVAYMRGAVGSTAVAGPAEATHTAAVIARQATTAAARRSVDLVRVSARVRERDACLGPYEKPHVHALFRGT